MYLESSSVPPMPDYIDSDRLVLRPPRMGDGAMINEAIRESFPELSRWMPWARHMPSIPESETFAREAAARFRTREELPLLIIRKKDGLYLGSTGMHNINWEVPRFEIGYWIRTSMSGHGYMTEAVKALTAFTFETLNAVRMEIRCDSRNERSAAVARRAGYTLEAKLKWEGRDNDGGLRDTLIFCKLRDDGV